MHDAAGKWKTGSIPGQADLAGIPVYIGNLPNFTGPVAEGSIIGRQVGNDVLLLQRQGNGWVQVDQYPRY